MPERGTNGFNSEELKQHLDEIDAADDELLELKMSHMTKCKGPREKIRNAMAAAKEAGLNMSSFRTVVAAHRAERKIEARIAELEADDQADFELMQQALGAFGETPLGEAALARAKAKQRGDKVMSSLNHN